MLKKAVKCYPKMSFLLRMQVRCRALLYKNSQYSLFDPHACNSKGLPDPNGKAYLLSFHSIDDVIRHLNYIAEHFPYDQVDINPVFVAVLAGDEAHSVLASADEVLCISSSADEGDDSDNLLTEEPSKGKSICQANVNWLEHNSKKVKI